MRKIDSANKHVLSGQNVAPKKTGQRSAEGEAECAVVDAESHAVYRGPKGPVGDGDTVALVDGLPCLDYAGEENGSADVCACELFMGMRLVDDVQECGKLKLTLHKMTERTPMP